LFENFDSVLHKTKLTFAPEKEKCRAKATKSFRETTYFNSAPENIMKKPTLILIFLFALSANAFATGQAPDVLYFEGKVFKLFSNPLESLYKNDKDRPVFAVAPGTISSGNWRGYVAHWEILDETLYLKGIDSWICKKEQFYEETGCARANIKELFAARYNQGKVFAEWFSGDLRIPDGKQLQYVGMGYGSVYERDIVISVKQGKITGKQIVDNTKKQPENEMELQRKELEKLKKSPLGNKKIS
jgi:hypothetical protein